MATSSSASTPIKIKDNPGLTCSPAQVSAPLSSPAIAPPSIIMHPKDPEGYLRRCSGLNKKTNARCSATIGKNAKSLHPTFLPTCHAHRDQQSFAARCQFMELDGETCDLLFRWEPPYFKLCDKHQSHPNSPCHFMNLPLELRQEIFRYLLPTQPIGSSSSPLHWESSIAASSLPAMAPPPPPSLSQPFSIASRRVKGRDVVAATSSPGTRLFPFSIVDLFLISRRVYHEVKDLLYSSIPFIIDIRKDGTFMCGRRLLEPRRADGSAHSMVHDETGAKKFTSTFEFAAVKNYNVDILVENGTEESNPSVIRRLGHTWDEEVEIYDIRDYVGVVVSGILLKARNLCRLNVRLAFSKFNWPEEEILSNTKRLVGPFERLRNVRQPKFCGVFGGSPSSNFMISVPSNAYMAAQTKIHQPRQSTLLCSVPILPTHTMLLGPGNSKFDAYKEEWEKWASEVVDSLPERPPIRGMFTELKQFYTKLSNFVPEVTHRIGRRAFLHRARVARENENVEAFRHIRNELIEYWHLYLEQKEQQKKTMDSHLSRMLDSDVYPSHEADSFSPPRSSNLDSDCDFVHRLSTQGNPGSHKRKRPTMDAKQIRLGYIDSAQAEPSSSGSSRPLPDKQGMSLNPSAALERPSLTQQQVRRLEACTWAQAQRQGQVQARAEVHLQGQAMSMAKVRHSFTQQASPSSSPAMLPESNEPGGPAQKPPSALYPATSQPQTSMLPGMPEQQKMLPRIVGPGEMRTNLDPLGALLPLAKSSSSSSAGSPSTNQALSSWASSKQETNESQRSYTPCTRCQRSKVNCISQGVDFACHLCESSGADCVYLPPSSTTSVSWEHNTPSPVRSPQRWQVENWGNPRQDVQQEPHSIDAILQQQQGNWQYAEQGQVEIQPQQFLELGIQNQRQVQRYHEPQPTFSTSATAQKVAKIQIPSDRSAIGSTMSVHTTISCQTPGSIIHGDSSTNSWTLLDQVYGAPILTQKQPYDYNDGNSQLPNQKTVPSLKKRRINAATNDMDGYEDGNETGYDGMMVVPEQQQRQPVHDGLTRKCPVEYMGKGKDRAIEPREIICLD